MRELPWGQGLLEKGGKGREGVCVVGDGFTRDHSNLATLKEAPYTPERGSIQAQPPESYLRALPYLLDISKAERHTEAT